MVSLCFENLINKVIEASKSNVWDEAVAEWVIGDCMEDESCSECCICGHDHIRYLYTIHNIFTNKSLYPIGSTCIKKFERDELDEEINILEQMFKLFHAIENKQFIVLSSDFFSRKLLFALYERGAFAPSKFNSYNAENDYNFLLKMFNRKDKSSISVMQQNKINGLIAYSIKPYLLKTLKFKSV